MDELLFKLLEQTPTIIVLGVGIWTIWKDRNAIAKDSELERKEMLKLIERLTKEHRLEVRELQSYQRMVEKDFLNMFGEICNTLEQISDNIKPFKN